MPPPACRTVFSTPDATPERVRGTVASNADVISGTDSPTPNGITTRPGSNDEYSRRCLAQSRDIVTCAGDDQAQRHWNAQAEPMSDCTGSDIGHPQRHRERQEGEPSDCRRIAEDLLQRDLQQEIVPYSVRLITTPTSVAALNVAWRKKPSGTIGPRSAP